RQQQYQQLFDERERLQVKKAFVRYYDWMGNNLYQMLTESDVAEHPSDLKIVALEYANLRHALQLSLALRFNFNFILLPLNAWLEATGQHPLWQKIIASMLAPWESLPENRRSFDIWHGLTHLYDTLGATCLRNRAFAEAEHWFRLAIETYFKGKQDEVYPAAHGGLAQNLASALSYQEKWKESEAVYGQILEIGERHGHEETIATYYLNYGSSKIHQGKQAEAVPLLKIAVEKNKARGDTHAVGLSSLHLGSAHAALSAYDEAWECFELAMGCFEQLSYAHLQAEVTDALVNMLLKQRNFEAVKKAAKKSLTWHILHEKPFHLALIYQALGVACIGLAEWDEGCDYFSQAARLFQKTGSADGVEKILAMAREVDKKRGKTFEEKILAHLQ
ncbi:MAG: hypothetical protein AAB316_19275, partial [Bacteroidota bacterium]